MSKNWSIYIVKCSDKSLYTGITTNTERRLEQHNSKRGAKALKGKLPVELVYTEKNLSKSEALKREAEIKKLTRSEKLDLIKNMVAVAQW